MQFSTKLCQAALARLQTHAVLFIKETGDCISRPDKNYPFKNFVTDSDTIQITPARLYNK